MNAIMPMLMVGLITMSSINRHRNEKVSVEKLQKQIISL